MGCGAGAGVDSVWEQKKLEARKMLVNRADSPASSARFVSPLFAKRLHGIKQSKTILLVILLLKFHKSRAK